MLRVSQQEDIWMLRIVSHHGHKTNHAHALTGCGFELDRGHHQKHHQLNKSLSLQVETETSTQVLHVCVRDFSLVHSTRFLLARE